MTTVMYVVVGSRTTTDNERLRVQCERCLSHTGVSSALHDVDTKISMWTGSVIAQTRGAV